MNDEVQFMGPPHMRMVQMPLALVDVDPRFNCRQYTTEQIEKACASFDGQAMLHAPTVAHLNGRWILVAGFKRFAVWQATRKGVGLFRFIEGDEAALRLTNLAENMLRDDPRPHEFIAGLVALREAGHSAARVALHCGVSDRWVRKVWQIRRNAHPDIWAEFISGESPDLTLERVKSLSSHPPESQPDIWARAKRALQSADHALQGYSEQPLVFSRVARSARPFQPRRRMRKRREVERYRESVRRDVTLDRAAKEAVDRAIGWILEGGEGTDASGIDDGEER